MKFVSQDFITVLYALSRLKVLLKILHAYLSIPLLNNIMSVSVGPSNSSNVILSLGPHSYVVQLPLQRQVRVYIGEFGSLLSDEDFHDLVVNLRGQPDTQLRVRGLHSQLSVLYQVFSVIPVDEQMRVHPPSLSQDCIVSLTLGQGLGVCIGSPRP